MQFCCVGVVDVVKFSLIGCVIFIESFVNDYDGDEVVCYLGFEYLFDWYVCEFGNLVKVVWLVEEVVGCLVGYVMVILGVLFGVDFVIDFELKCIYMLLKWYGGGWGVKLFRVVEDEVCVCGVK